ncbi:MAG: hypothetical protein ACYC6F_04055 [Longimicrobiales bacterium]
MIARFLASLAIVWVVFAACEHNPAGIDAPGPLATITVLPNPDTLRVGTTRQFVAVGKDARGNVVEVTPSWTVVAEGGTIAGGGLFTAGTVPGTYVGTVKASAGGISGLATVTVVPGPLSTITVTPDPADLVISATQPFTATGKDAFGNVVPITPTWSVAAGGGAIDAGSGLFTAGTVPGAYAETVVATSGAISGSATVNVTAGPLAAITVSPNPATLGMGASQLFTAVGTDAGGNVLAITPTWSVVAGGGAINGTSGLFAAGTLPGTYANTVKATSGGISGFATVIVSGGALATITVTPDPANLGINGVQQFTASGKDAFGNVMAITPEWSVVAGGGAIDSGSGLFTAGMVTGIYTNTVRASSGTISGFATVIVSAGALATITVTPDPADLGVGAAQQFTAVGRDASGNVVAITPTWAVAASGGAIDAGSGLFTAGTAPGTYANTVQATSGGISGFATVTVSVGALASITVTPDPANLGVGTTQQFTATGRDAFGNVVAFTPAWSSVAGGGTIDGSSGLFTAGTAPGTYANTVKATSGGISGFATVTVSAGALATITITPTPVSLATATSQQFTATGRDASGNVVAITPVWSTVAGGGTTNGTGLFTAGTVPGTFASTVVATSGGISGSATVTVVAGPLATISVSPDPVSLVIGAAQQFTAVGRDASGNVVAITPVWSTVVGGGTIDGSSGLFTAGTMPGTFTHTVVATSDGISAFATVTVVVGPLATITVSPDPSDLGIGATQTFTAVGRDAAGNVIAITPTWSVIAGGGTIAGSGVFTAGNLPGTYANTVQATSGGISGLATVTVRVGALASITVAPDPASLAVGATQQFTATGKDAFGNVVAITPAWSTVVGGGTIGAGSGQFTAGTAPGTYTHTVKASSGGISGFATVAVVAGPLATLTVSPDPASIGIGAAQQFTAVGRDASGNVVPVTATWSTVAGGGTIGAGSGLFTAGTVPGTFTNTVVATSGGVSGSATVMVVAGPLATVTVSPDPASLGVGGTQTFTAVGRDASGNVIAITPAWSAVAGGGTVDAGSGVFTAGTTPGTYINTVRATSGGVTGFATVTVSAGALTSITVTPDPANLGVNAAQQFTATGKDAFGNAVAITPAWSTVAGGGTIDGSSGVFTAGTVPGTYANTVRATSGTVSGSATVTVSAGALASITITPDPANLGIGDTQQFTATGKDAFGNVVAITPAWSRVAGGGAINATSGLFTAGTVPGTFIHTVKATSDGISGFATVTVVAGPLATITVTPNPATLGIGATRQFTAVGTDAFGNLMAITPAWSVVAGGGTISGAGLFTAGTVPGTYANTVQATSGGVSGSATVNVVAGPLATVTVSPDPANLVIGAAQSFTAVGRDALGNAVAITPTWTVVAGGGIVNGSGLFTAGTVPGTYANTVQATSGGVSGSATVNVVAGPLATVAVSPNPASLGVGATQQFRAVGRDASGNVVAITPTWSVVAAGGAIASGTGLFTAGTAPGTFTKTIQATSGGVFGFATVTVLAGALASIAVTPNPASLAATTSQQFTATGRDAFGNVVAITPTWSVVAGGGTGNGSGLFTAGTVPGTYANTVKATSGGVSGFATVNVIAGPLATITVSPDPANLGIGATQLFTAVGKDASGNVVAVAPTWSVVAGGGAVASGSGVFTAGTVPGTYTNTVQAASGGVSGFATVTVSAGPLASIAITPDPANLGIGATQSFTAVGRDASGNVVAFAPTWSVVAGGGVIDSGSGLFTAGTVPGIYTNTVRATSGDISDFATVTVSAGALASITLTPDPANLGIGSAQQFTATGKDAFGNVVAITPTWSVVASGGTVDSGSGLFTAGTVPGTFTNTVRATSGGISGFATVNVAAGALATITVSPDPADLGIGATQTFTAVGRDAFGNVVAVAPTWSVVADGGTIDGSSGLFTAGTTPGTFTNTVVATSGGVTGAATVNLVAGALATITVTPNPASLGVGAAQQFTAVGRDASGNPVAITPTWAVVAGGGTGNGSGLFTAGTVPGTYTNTVKATSDGVSGFATVTVVAGPLASITVTPDPADLGIGATQQFTATGKDAFGNLVAIAPTWSVVAGGGSVSGSGLFTAGTVPGTYANTVQATSGAVSGSATVNLVAGPLATITVSPNPASLGIGATRQFTAVGRDASGNVVAITPTWSVVAGGGTVASGSGLFTAGTLPGTYANTVQAVSGGVSGFATVTVFAGALASITVTPDPVGLAPTASQQFTATGRDASGNVVSITPVWSVVAGGGTVNSGSGLFTAGSAPGTYTNTVKAASGGVSGFATVTVNAGALASITVTPNPVTLASTASQQFTATGRDAFGNVVAVSPTWSTVAGGGLIDGVGLFTAGTLPGTYTNTVQATSGGVSGFATVTVIAGPLASITITPDPASVGVGATQTFTAVGRDASGNVVAITPTWSVAAGGGTIDSGSGLFTAGTVPGTYINTVVATSGGISEFATVNVVAGPLATITVSPDPADLGIGATQTFTAVGRDASGNVVAVAPTWSVVSGGGTIDGSSGLFTAGTTPGTYTNTVVATSGGITGAATVTLVAGSLATVTVSPNPSNLVIGATQTFTAVGRDGSGNVVAITPTWSVVAGGGSVDSGSGLFTAGTTPGTFTNTVKATSGGISGFATVNVAAGPLATITVSPNPATVGVAATRQFTAVGRDASGNVVAITPAWSVVASGGTINGSSGLFTAGTVPGTFTNTVQATSGSISGRATVTVTAGALASITVTPNPVSLAAGTSQQFTATGRDAFGNVVAITPAWSVVAGGGTVDSGSGLFTAGTVPGTYTNTVQATSGGVSGLATVTVVAGPLATINVSPDPADLGIGAAQQFTATGRDAFGNVVAITPAWSTVAGGGTINASGLFTAGTLPGTYTNTVQATSGGVSGFASVAIVAGPLATITVSPDPAALGVGGTQQFTAVGMDGSGNVVAITPTWSVVAGGGSIAGSGMFTAGAVPGTYANTVQATSGAISGFATVTVTVNLGAAASFAVLGGGAGASSCTGVSSVSGNVGVSPSGTMSGFPSPCVILAPGDGSVHLNDATAAAGQAAVTTANGTLTGMAQTADMTGQDLGGKTLAPGVYDFTSTAQLTGTLTLDGPADGIWVFRIGTALTTAAGAKVTLAGSAQAGNVYWQVGSSATLGATNDSFQGTIIAAASITLGSGTKLIGRAFARTGAVVMVTNLITLP